MLVAAAVILLIAAAVFYLGATGKRPSATAPQPSTGSGQVRADSAQYKFINPLLYSDSPRDVTPPFRALRATLSAYATSSVASGDASSVSVYFRDLNTGAWTGINQDDTYAPSSMLKVVAMMAALKLAEANPSILDEKLAYSHGSSEQQFYAPAKALTPGSHTLSDLIDQMVVYSDNDALTAVLSDQHINQEFTSIYSQFRLPPAALGQQNSDFMSPKSFAVIFRILYNSSFFQWSLSEQVLSLLSQTDFDVGLVAGVPAGTAVSHKFGENTNVALPAGDVVDRELHDCGIVYYPDHPYLLCVMTRGQDYTKLQGVISGASAAVWGYVSTRLYPQ